ncbi:unnamed protein product [Adineta steineri]|uniref:Uncharacterized protein n=1 Tax=Adineta steineri TaxID=433720 RepID=A0A813TMX4_9BILA|nr:unnamed protein product [Adineta steineri]CAF3842443.1 unnamed protein product [Adineta steineri]
MDDVVVDPNDLLRQFDSVSRAQRSLFAEFERQRSRLIQLVRWYDHQQTARGTELRRQFEQVNKESRRQIYHRSKMTIKERSRLKHILDDDDNKNHLFSINHSKTCIHRENPTDEKKRQVYGCLLPQFKAPLEKSYDNWSQDFFSNRSEYQKRLERQQWLINKYTQSPIEQRNRMNIIIDKCLNELVECDSDGYDHFLQTSEPNRNAQILAQQNIKHKNQNNIK